MTKLLFIIFFLYSLIGFSQSGKITVRKNSTNLLGKTLQLNDLRGARAGTVNFTTKNKAIVKLEIDIKNPVIKLNFEKQIPLKEILNCSYSIIDDSLLVLTHNKFSDTCYYKYINKNTNVVQLKNTLHGVITEEDFAICYHLDSILYSQTYNKSVADAKFNQNIEFDSIYKNVADKKLKKELEESLKKELEEYSNSISYNYFKGKYLIDKNKLKLFVKNINFTDINFNKNDSSYIIKSPHLLDGSKQLSSLYTHYNYGNLILRYETAYIDYIDKIHDTKRKSDVYITLLKVDTFLIKYINDYKSILIKGNDTLTLWQNNNFTNARINNALGGFYQTHFKALNGNKIPFKKLLFTAKEAIEVNNNYAIKSNTRWEYKITDSALYLFNKSDTLVDELTNSWESFSFTYHNNEPFVFGTYHYKTTDNKHEFLILFSNNTGVKFTRDEFEYKEARRILAANNFENLKSTDCKKFKFSASKEFIWLNFDDGKYQKISFFNHNKALREQTKEQTNNYYLIE